MKAEELLQAGRLEESLIALQEVVRANPADGRGRVFLFQMLCVLGQWQRALTQLDVLAGVSSDHLLLANLFRPVIHCEMLRAQVFAGTHTPILFGEPLPWMGWLVQANTLTSEGKFGPAQELRDRAFEEAPATPGKVNEQAFEWLADADLRLGPMLEAYIEGKYYWVPVCRIKRVYIEPPTDLRDLVWAPAQFVWANGGEGVGHIPARYPGTENCEDGQLRLARKTDWAEQEGGGARGLGQRVLATDSGEFPLLECRTIDLAPAG
ncbi:MAG TPA: type VI secretion system accessory protein TagJ [Verrucomicrobiae bacterium]|nr:type VI secretion system accessory protein TagJ [Verrucomicrobiae bacterium]